MAESPLRITFVLPLANLAGGIRVLAVYARLLSEMGHRVLVVSQPRPALSARRKVRMLLRGKGWPGPPPPEPSHFDSLNVPHQVLSEPRPVRDADLPDADVVVATWWETAEWVGALSASKGAKAYFIQHDERVWYSEQAEWTRRVEATWRMGLHKITISTWLLNLLSRSTPGDEIDLILNSVDTEVFHAPPRARQHLPTVGLLYHTDQFKNVALSLRVIERVRHVIGNLQVVAFGAQPVSADLPLPAGSRFVLRPPQQEIRELYAACDAWLSCSRAEGFNLPPLEAMACRCPVVCTRVGGMMDLITNGREGYLADIDDEAGLADHLQRVLSLPEEGWQAMSEAAYGRALSYTWRDAAMLFEKSLRRAIKAQVGSAGSPGERATMVMA